MEMIEVEAFVSVAALGGFTRAADALGISQPAVSRRVDLLERELGAPLCERLPGSAGVRLTQAGQAFLPHAQAILGAARAGAQAVYALEHAEAGEVTLALVGALATSELAVRLSAFRQRYPRVHLSLRTGASEEVTSLVKSGAANLALRFSRDDDPTLEWHPHGEEPLAVICGPAHRLASAVTPLPPDSLTGESWVTLDGSVLRRVLAAGSLAGADLVEIGSREAQRALISAGFGLGLVPRAVVAADLATGALCELDVPALAHSMDTWLVRRRGYHVAAARHLHAALGTP